MDYFLIYTSDKIKLNEGNACVASDGTKYRSKVTKAIPAPVVTRTFASGDSVHALPFTMSLVEVQPMAGSLTYMYGLPAQRSIRAVCGQDALYRERSAIVDSGWCYHNTLRPAQLAADLVLENQLRAIAETKALANLRQSLNNVPLLFAERRETIEMVRRKGLQIGAAVRARHDADYARWAKTRLRDKRRVARDIAGEHLAFLFGFLPLIGEVEGLCEQLSEDAVAIVTGRGRMASMSAVTKSATNSVSTSTFQNYTSIPFTYTLDDTKRYSFRTSIQVEITSAAAARLRKNGFNPIASAYDLVPLSFLSDFVSNLGTFLRALDPVFGVNFITGNSTLWREYKQTCTVSGASFVIPHKWAADDQVNARCTTTGNGKGTSRALYVRRWPLSDFPIASLHFVNNLSVSKAATIASLAIQRYLKPLQVALRRKEFRYKGKRPKWLPPIKYKVKI